MRALLIRIANDVGFPAPAPTDGLTEWADEALDTALTRGSPAWREAHAHVLDALLAAASDDELGARKALELARNRARAEGRSACSCPPSAEGQRVVVGTRRLCVKCAGRG